MNVVPYPYKRFHNKYKFISLGKKQIQKVVEFSLLDRRGLYNVCFGNSLPGIEIDDMDNSNNGDLPKVLATVIRIVIDFLARKPKAIIFFTGSTEVRTRMYGRILKTNYAVLKDHYDIRGSLRVKNKVIQTAFDPDLAAVYFEYYLQKKI